MAAYDAFPMLVSHASPSIVRVQMEELPSHLATLEAELDGGRCIELLRGDRVVAEIRARQVEAIEESKRRPMPDFMARLRNIYGDTPLDVNTTAWIREDRDGDEHLP